MQIRRQYFIASAHALWSMGKRLVRHTCTYCLHIYSYLGSFFQKLFQKKFSLAGYEQSFLLVEQKIKGTSLSNRDRKAREAMPRVFPFSVWALKYIKLCEVGNDHIGLP